MQEFLCTCGGVLRCESSYMQELLCTCGCVQELLCTCGGVVKCERVHTCRFCVHVESVEV